MHAFQFTFHLLKLWTCFRFLHVEVVKCSGVCSEGTILITKVLNCFKMDAGLKPRKKMCQLCGKVLWRLANPECRSRELTKDLPQANVSAIFHEDFLSFLVTNTFAPFLSLQYLFQPLQLP
jgi:hypothetical protein